MKKAILIWVCFMLSATVADAVCYTASAVATAPASDFTDNGNGTITHNKTQLMWKQCSEGLSGAGCATGAAATYNWQTALQAAETLNNGGGLAGFTDWRMPNIKELKLIVEYQCAAPAINPTIFPATVAGIYWSTTPYLPVPAAAIGLDFNGGNDGGYSKATGAYYLRLVRGGL